MAPTGTPNVCFDDLPRQKSWGSMDFLKWEGFWYLPSHLEGAMAAQSRFEARDDDVFLTSSCKTGTTWLKALIPSIMRRDEDDDPLEHNHPNELIPSLELQLYKGSSNPDLEKVQNPRLFRTHLPYSSLPESIKSGVGGCKMVYISREPKDTFVSFWHFINKQRAARGQDPCPMTEAFDSFCRGVHPFGPFHDHVMEFWKESLKRPEKILFMRYEDMKRDPRGEVKKLASFIGKPFVDDEEADKVLSRCSLERLKSLDVNKDGPDPWTEVPKSAYFRRGVVGDWKNTLSLEMKDRLDEITRTKFEGSDLHL